MSRAKVSILIPTYEAAEFIDRTLMFARGQTLRDVTILVSVDTCSDGTVERVREIAREDARIRCFHQSERLGWAGNVNFLLDQTDTPYAFIYFHDDVIVPQYAEKMLAVLEASPDAASVQCDMLTFGGSSGLQAGRAFLGDATQRLLTFMLAPNRGAPLRALIRCERLGHVRLPVRGEMPGYLLNEPFLLARVAAGQMLHLPETLYLRWDLRPGGLVESSWRSLTAPSMVAAIQANTAHALATIHASAANADERAALTLACWLWTASHILSANHQAGHRLFSHPEEVHPAFGDLPALSALSDYGADVLAWAEQRSRFAAEAAPAGSIV